MFKKCREVLKKVMYMGSLIMCMLLFVSGCATKEQMQKLAKIEEQAKNNAIEYIQEKYGFKAKVVAVEGHTGYDSIVPNHEPTGSATVTLKYEGKEFYVDITGEEVSTEGIDNYQSDEILKDIYKRAMSALNLEVDNVYIEVTCDSVDNRVMTGVYYNGENMDEILTDWSGCVDYKVVAKNADLQAIDIERLKEEIGEFSDMLIINCDNDKDYDIMKAEKLSYFNMGVEDYAMYMDDYIYITRRDTEYVDLEMIEFDGFTIGMFNGTYCNVEKTIIDSKEWKGHGLSNGKQIFDAYSVESDAEKLYFYVNTDELDTKNYDHARIVTRYYKDGNLRYDGGVGTNCINSTYLTEYMWSNDCTDIVFSVFEDID